jgi:carboxyl-terminal processing protease
MSLPPPAPAPRPTAPRRPPVLRIAAALLLALTLGQCTPTNGAAADPGTADSADLAIIREAMKQVESSYVEPVKPSRLVTDALKGMLTGLDPHSDYMDEREYHELMTMTSGEFGGVGIELSVEQGVPQVISAIDGTPAAAAGIEPGDRIIKANGLPTIGIDIDTIVKRLRGAPGTRVVLTIARANRQPFDVALTRAVIHVVSVKSAIEPDRIGYVHVSTFSENTPSELAGAIAQLRQEAGRRGLTGLVLDLRNNAGGLLDSGIDVAADFLDGGTVVTTRGRDPDENHIYDAPPNGDLIRGTPMVVLINGASASAAEIVAGALQDDRRATLMGTRSFGKGSVQSIIPLDDRGALRLTTALYYTPDGRSIQGLGITPNIIVTVPPDEQVANAVVTYESDLYGTLKNGGQLGKPPLPPNGAPAQPEPSEAQSRPINPAVLGKPADAQLKAAIAYLEEHRAAAR